MVDLTEFTGESALRASLQKKRDKAQEKLSATIDIANKKIQPLQEQVEKLDAMLALLSNPKQNLNNDDPLPESGNAADWHNEGKN